MGHLYVGKTNIGVPLLCLHVFLLLLSFIPFMWLFFTFPAWLITFIFASINASNAAKEFNWRNGITVH